MQYQDKRIPLKTPWIAALLAFLVPGMGHIYQGRFFKGTLYAVCILGTFLMGICMGEGKVVYTSEDNSVQKAGRRKSLVIGFFAQSGVGMFSIPAYVQAQRYFGDENVGQETLDEELTVPFDGMMISRTVNDAARREAVQGEISLRPVSGDFGPVVRGTFVGTDAQGNQVTLDLGEPFELEKPIAAREGRSLECDIVMGDERRFSSVGKLRGAIPRSWINRFEVPLDKSDLEDLNGRLGKFYELALVYTWIAGLLNLLAIWDAFEGPAYGYGDAAAQVQPAIAAASPRPAVVTGSHSSAPMTSAKLAQAPDKIPHASGQPTSPTPAAPELG